MVLPMLTNVVSVIGLAILVVCITQRLRAPSIVGYLLTGVLVGSGGLGIVQSHKDVEFLAEMGVVALLFTIGLEFSVARLWEMRRSLLISGGAQVALTAAGVALIVWRLGMGPRSALFVGFAVALSSTAVVLSLLERRAEVHTPHGRVILGALLFQDVAVVPMMLAVPLLAGQRDEASPALLPLLAKGLAVLALFIIAGRWFVPPLLYRVARSRERELFMLTVIFLALGVAWLTSQAGLSLALGAFLAGLIVSESEYSQRALGSIMPLRDVFTSFFFISVGMLLDVSVILQYPWLVLGLTVGVIGLKSALAGVGVALLGLPLRTLILSGMALAQIGEFSFVLYSAGMAYGLLDEVQGAIFLAVAVGTLVLTPACISVAPWVASLAQRLPLPARWQGVHAPEYDGPPGALSDHLVIIGFGFNGAHLAQVAQEAGIAYVVLEMNPDTVRRERQRGLPITLGDATQEATLRHLHIERARMVVVAISDAAASRRATELARRLSPGCRLVVRTRFLGDVDTLKQLGADEVIPAEFETAVAIFRRVLECYCVPEERITSLVAQIRADNYHLLRSDQPLVPPR